MDSDESMKIDLDGEKIAITLCAESFSNYRVMSASPAYLPVFHSILILPALIYVFETLKRSGTEEFEQRRWFRAICKTLSAQGLKLDQTTLDTYESFELAQKLLELSVNKAITALAQLGDSVEDEQ